MSVRREAETSPQNTTGKVSGIFVWKKHPTFHRQLIAFLCGLCGNIASGLTYAITGTLLPQIRGYVKPDEDPWITSCNLIATLIGILLSSFLMRKYGRKPMLMYPNVPWILGWIVLYTSRNLATVLLAFAIIGFSSGFSNTAVLVYVIEIAEPKLRGFLAAFSNVFFAVGIFVGHLLGILLDWRTSVALYAAFPALALLFSFFLPESPNWLIIQGRTEEAERIFFWLRGVNPQSRNEYDNLLDKRSENRIKHSRGAVKNLFTREFFQPCLVMVVMFAVSIGSGIDILVYYAIDTLGTMSHTIPKEAVLITINAVRVVMAIVSAILIKKWRRKPLFFASTLGTLLFMVSTIVCIEFLVADTWLILNLCLYIGAANVGLGSIPWIMIAEIFPQILRDTGSGVVHMYVYFLSFCLAQVHPRLVKRFDFSTTMSIYAVFMLICAVFLYFIMPETEKFTLQEVEDKVLEKRIAKISRLV